MPFLPKLTTLCYTLNRKFMKEDYHEKITHYRQSIVFGHPGGGL